MRKKENKSVLIIDDEQDICFLLGNLLKQKRYNVEIAHTLRDGFIKLGQSHPQFLFLDVHLPDGSGLELLKTIKQDYPDLKIIMISAFDGITERKKASENGASAYLSKPLNQQSVLQTLDN